MFELNAQTRWILGRPNFACSPVANQLRKMGYTIGYRAEEEQAAVIHWMLCQWEQHGDQWTVEANKLLDTVQ